MYFVANTRHVLLEPLYRYFEVDYPFIYKQS